jgi:hypothetical protein
LRNDERIEISSREAGRCEGTSVDAFRQSV